MKKVIHKLLSSGFSKGIVCGAVLTAVFFLSWRLVLAIGGLLLVYYLFQNRR